MSRTVISVVVAAVIAVLTAVALFVTTSGFEERSKKEADLRVTVAYQALEPLLAIDGVQLSTKAERLSHTPEFLEALKPSNADRARDATRGFDRYLNGESRDANDILALVDKAGLVVAINGVDGVTPKQWLAPDGKSTIIPALDVVLKKKGIISDVWNYAGRGIMRVAVASVVDPKSDDENAISGAVVIAHAITANDAQNDKLALGADVAYFDQKKLVASSFTHAGAQEDTGKARDVNNVLAALGTSKVRVTIDGEDYLAWAREIPRQSTIKPLPPEYPKSTAGALALAPIETSPVAGTVRLFLLVIGVSSIAMALLGLYLLHRGLETQVDQIELGVTEIINGNLDRTFRPVGPELDGLANGLNVMLSRLLGRPEPGEEEFDEEGNPIMPGRVDFEEGDASARPGGADPDLAALAHESEPDYYKRVFTEYQAARKAAGKSDDGSFENFIAKLKVNEGKLRAQFNCRAVRFRVVDKDGKVSLKPVPIF
jgi:hypothetical protein